MNIIKNSSVAFAVSIAELTHVRHAGAGGNLARHRDLPGGDGLYFISAFTHQPHRLFIEQRVQVPGMIRGGGK
jgi:glutamate/aspartate transport system permease protein